MLHSLPLGFLVVCYNFQLAFQGGFGVAHICCSNSYRPQSSSTPGHLVAWSHSNWSAKVVAAQLAPGTPCGSQLLQLKLQALLWLACGLPSD